MGTTKRGGNTIEKLKVAVSTPVVKSTLVYIIGSSGESHVGIRLMKSCSLSSMEPRSFFAAQSTWDASCLAGDKPMFLRKISS
jgi:hypothetical protein